jgi:hypothetical protein
MEHIDVDVASLAFLLFLILCRKRNEETDLVSEFNKPDSLCTVLSHLSFLWKSSELQKQLCKLRRHMRRAGIYSYLNVYNNPALLSK